MNSMISRLGSPWYCKMLLPRRQYCVVLIKRPNMNPCLCYKTLNLYSSKRTISWTGFIGAISNSYPVIKFEDFLIEFHNISSLPWWMEIFIVTLGIRSLFVFPLAVHQNQVIGRLANVNKQLGEMAPELNKEVNVAARLYKWDNKTARIVFKRQMRAHYQKLVIRENCHPFKTVLLAVFQLPVWICFSFSLRNLTFGSIYQNFGTETLLLQLKTEGVLWFTDLTVPDAFVMPLLLFFVNLMLIELGVVRRFGTSSLFQIVLSTTLRLTTCLVAFVASVNPCCVTFYWLCSSSLGLMQNFLLMSPKIRRLLKIPITKNESSTPYQDIVDHFRARLLKLKKYIK